jgi:hypothetical protein
MLGRRSDTGPGAPALGCSARHRRHPQDITIPKTSRPERLAENFAIYDFALSAAQMAAIGGLDPGRRFNDPGVFCERAFNTFFRSTNSPAPDRRCHPCPP